jgi:hypothetical protein
MKLNLTRILVLLTAIIFFYTACTKTNTKPVTPVTTATIDYDALGKQIALNLVKSLNGFYGGADITKGIATPADIGLASHRGLVTNRAAVTNSQCGFTIDTTYNTKTTVGDSAKTFFGNFKFVYNCDSSRVDGYTVHDSLTNTEKGTKFNNTFIVAQDYVVKALDQAYKLVSMDGSIFSSIYNGVLTNGATTGYQSLISHYILSGVKVDFSSGVADITTGTATFNSSTANLNSTTPIDGSTSLYTGTITFLGNHMAKLTINGTTVKSYSVNLLTGATTAL